MKKILIDRTDTIAAAVGKVLTAPDTEVTLVIPRNSPLKDSVTNFHLLKREAAAAGRTVTIESVDETILALAVAAELKTTHPLFKEGNANRSIVDIVPRAAGKGVPSLAKEAAVPEAPAPEETERDAESVRDEREDARESVAPSVSSRVRRAVVFRPRIVGALVILVGIGGAGVWVVNAFFSRADVTLNFRKTPWQYEGMFLASKTVTTIDPETLSLPAQVFSEERNLTQLFPASGKATVSEKAKGRITISNAFSSQPQLLVATTRFMTPDGIVFRLDDQVMVPGAEIKDGKVAPSSIDANVTADKAGPEYNVGPVPRLSIPGFKGTPRYEGFYGAFKDGTKGGFVGEKAVPTDADVDAARTRTTEIIRTSLESGFLTVRPEGFVIPDKASEVTITKMSVKRETDENGNFSVFGEGRFVAIGFRESDLEALLEEIALREHAASTFHELRLTYDKVAPDFERGEARLAVAADGTLTSRFSKDEFKTNILGQNVAAVRGLIIGLPNVADAKISLWPFWRGRIPQDPEQVEITVR